MKKIFIGLITILFGVNMLHAEIDQTKLNQLLKISLKLKKYMFVNNKPKMKIYSKKFESVKEELEKEANLLEEIQDPNLLEYIGLSYISPNFLFYAGKKSPNYELGLKFLKKAVKQGNLTGYCFIYKVEKKLNYPKPMLDEVKTKIYKFGIEEKCKKLVDKF